MTEASVQSVAADYLHLRGWRIAHFRPARTAQGWRTPGQYDAAGFPDLCIARDGLVHLVEVKSGRGRTTAAQEAWLAAADGFLLTPKTLDQFMERYR